jgi:hypothetical protein
MDLLSMIERIAETGTAPRDGCSLFGVGYEDAFARLQSVYLDKRFARGGSAEKFVIGPFGSGKTHFLRQLMELARDQGCVTAEISLNRDIDFVQSLVVYREVAREIRPPGSEQTGVGALLDAALERVRAQAPTADAIEPLLHGWVSALEGHQLKHDGFARMMRRALDARLREDDTTFEACCRWLGGEVHDRILAKDLGVAVVAKAEQNIFARRATLSLFQFVRFARFPGTVVTFDEAEQGLAVDKRRMQRILSMLQSDINAIADLEGGSALVVYALTPDIVEQMERFAALAQRVADPGPGSGFFDGNARAPKIDLRHRGEPARELALMGRQLAEVLYQHASPPPAIPREAVLERIETLASEVATDDPSTSSRRTMMKRTASVLMQVVEEGTLGERTSTPAEPEDEV